MLSGAKHLLCNTDGHGAFKILHCVQNDMKIFKLMQHPKSGFQFQGFNIMMPRYQDALIPGNKEGAIEGFGIHRLE